MDHYRIYVLDSVGRIAWGHDALCAGDPEAQSAASGLLEPGQTAEVWTGRRRVGRVTVGGGHAPAYAGVSAMVANDVAAQDGRRSRVKH